MLKQLQSHTAGRWESGDSHPPRAAQPEHRQGFALSAGINLMWKILFKIPPSPDVFPGSLSLLVSLKFTLSLLSSVVRAEGDRGGV